MAQLNAHQAACMQANEVLLSLRVDVSSGLTSDDVILRRMRYGENECTHDEDEPLWKKYGEQFVNPLILLLLGSAIVSLLMKQFDDALSIALAIFIVVTVAFVQEYRSEKTLEALNKLVPPSATCIRDGAELQLLAKELVPGDIIVLRMGDRVPADTRLVDAIDVEIDESSFTGETHPSRKMIMPLSQISSNGHVSHLTNIAFMGTLVRCGRARGVVIGTGHNSEFGDVFKMMQAEHSPKTPLQKSMDELGKQLSIYSFAIIGLIFLLGIIQGRAVLDMFTIAVSLAVAAIPEGLPIVVTVTLAIGVMRMARQKAIVKKLPTVETLGCVNVICCDKTGTLTKNEMTATCVLTPQGREANVTGIGYNFDGGLCMLGHEAVMGWSHPQISRIIEIACVCNNAEITRTGELHGTPTELALIVLAHKARLHASCQRFVRIKESPFNSDTKWMSVLVQPPPDATNKRPMFMVKGAVDRILAMCTHLIDDEQSSDVTIPMNNILKESVLVLADRLGSKGLRVIAVASGASMDALIFAGMIAIQDPPRLGVRESIEVVQGSGVDIKMITGDALHTALAIARDVGVIDNSIDPFKPVDESLRATHIKAAAVHALSGDDIDSLPEHELERLLPMTSIFYRAAPKHKLKIVKVLQNMGKITAMTGDGVNDAVALKKADIGIAMGKTGTDVSKEASDMILVEDDFPTISRAIEEGKGIFYNIRNFVRFQLSTSIAALTLIALSTIFTLPNPLNAMQILWINIIMDGPPAQSLGVEPVDRDVRKQAPRNINESMITKSLIVNILLSASIIISGTLAVFYMEMSDGIVTPRDTTMTFTTFVFFDMWNAIACRHSIKSVFTLGLFTNTMLVLAVSGSIIGQLAVIYLPPLQRIFQTESLYLNDLVHLALLTSSVFWISELKKLIERNMIAKRKKNLESPQSLYMI